VERVDELVRRRVERDVEVEDGLVEALGRVVRPIGEYP
jgi:hypothetical protein